MRLIDRWRQFKHHRFDHRFQQMVAMTHTKLNHDQHQQLIKLQMAQDQQRLIPAEPTNLADTTLDDNQVQELTKLRQQVPKLIQSNNDLKIANHTLRRSHDQLATALHQLNQQVDQLKTNDPKIVAELKQHRQLQSQLAQLQTQNAQLKTQLQTTASFQAKQKKHLYQLHQRGQAIKQLNDRIQAQKKVINDLNQHSQAQLMVNNALIAELKAVKAQLQHAQNER